MLSPYEIIEEAINEYGITEFWVGCSGGKDSITLSHWMYENYPEFMKGLVFADTGIAVPTVRPFLEEYCKKMGWNLKIVKAIKEYEEMVRKNGFPHVRAHVIVMRILKMIPVRRFILSEEMPKGSTKRVCVLLGVRQQESNRRMKLLKSPFYKDGRMIYVSPFLYKSDEWVYQYYLEKNLERSPAYDTIHISGDCLCGCFADKDEMRMLEIFYKEVADRIHKLEEELAHELLEVQGKLKTHSLIGSKVDMKKEYTSSLWKEYQWLVKRERLLIDHGRWGTHSYQQTKRRKKQTTTEALNCSDCFFSVAK